MRQLTLDLLVEAVRNENFEEAKRLVNDETLHIELWHDDCAMSPRENDNLGMMFTKHRKYINHDETDKDIDLILKDDDYITLPVYCYDHGTVAYSTKPFNCPWDSGKAGYITTSKARIKEYGLEDRSREEIERYLSNEIEEYSLWANGQVIGFSLVNNLGEVKESCGGFYSVDDMIGYISLDNLPFENNDELLEHLKSLEIAY